MDRGDYGLRRISRPLSNVASGQHSNLPQGDQPGQTREYGGGRTPLPSHPERLQPGEEGRRRPGGDPAAPPSEPFRRSGKASPQSDDPAGNRTGGRPSRRDPGKKEKRPLKIAGSSRHPLGDPPGERPVLQRTVQGRGLFLPPERPVHPRRL